MSGPFNTLINGFVREGRVTEAAGLFSKMVDTGCKPEASTMELIIGSLCQEKVDPALLPLIKRSL
jgi:pentatricopeptide repeat protein